MRYSPFLVFSLFALLFNPLNASALVKMDGKSIDLALKYGMQNQGLGYHTLLGNNWIEGTDGILLNIYTPFMMLASKTYRGGFPDEPTDTDIKNARRKFARTIRDFSDPNVPITVKFSVALYGNAPDFASGYSAWIEGFGRGKEFRLKTYQEIRQKDALKDPQAQENPYEAMNAYYFKFEDLALLDDYRFVLQSPTGEQTVFRIRNERIY